MGNCIRGEKYRWPNGIVPYVISDDFDQSEINIIDQSIRTWNQAGAGISFVPYTGPVGLADPFIEPYAAFVRGNSASSCSSVVGRQYPGQQIFCDFGGVVLVHEMGHTLGLKHEQQRFDRDSHVAVMLDNVIEDKRSNYRRMSIDNAVPVGNYDLRSMMHYGDTAFAVDFEINLEVPRVSSYVTPATVFFNGKLRAIIADQNRQLYHVSTADMVRWSTPRQIDEQLSKAPPSTVEFNGQIFLVHLGATSNDVWISSSQDGLRFSANKRIAGFSSRRTPSVAVHEGELHMTFIGSSDNEIRHTWSSTGDHDDWHEPQQINQRSQTTPAIASDGTQLHLVHVGNSSTDLWHSTSGDGRVWTQNVPIGQQSKDIPSLVSASGVLHLAHLGSTSNKIWHSRYSAASGKFSPNRETNQLSKQHPRLTALRSGDVILSHIGTESNQIYFSQYNPALRTMIAVGGNPARISGGASLSTGDIESVRAMYV